MRVRFGSRTPSYLSTGETTYIYVDIVNDANHPTFFNEEFYYSTDRRTWERLGSHTDLVDAGRTYTNLTTIRFTMPGASEVTLGLLWTARRVRPDGTIGEEVARGEAYHTIRNTRPTEGAPPEERAPQGCTKEEFRNSMVNTYRDRAVGWYDPYSPILDVTDTVRQVRENVEEARLTIFGSNLNAIRIEGPYDSLPPALTTEEIVSNWERGRERERQYCTRNRKYYWVEYPCRLDVRYREEAPPEERAPPEEEAPPEEAPTPFEWLLLLLLRLLFPFLPMQQGCSSCRKRM